MSEQICGLCGVIINGDEVTFSRGPKGDREKLYSKVCQYAKPDSVCINKNKYSGKMSNPDFEEFAKPVESYIDMAKEIKTAQQMRNVINEKSE